MATDLFKVSLLNIANMQKTVDYTTANNHEPGSQVFVVDLEQPGLELQGPLTCTSFSVNTVHVFSFLSSS